MIQNCKVGTNVTIGHGVIIDDGSVIGNDVFIGHNTVIRSGVKIGHGCVIGHLVLIERDTFIGRMTTIQSQCHITAEAEIGERVYFGPCVTIINEWKITKHRHHVTPQDLKGPKIGDGARIGTQSLIMPGVSIGINAMIGAGSVITKDVGEREIWRGPQALKVGMVLKEELI